jgi:multidrug efflux pump subunit AcrA (membrane-fusion protein)
VESARLENQRNEVISKIDAEKNQQALAEAEANLKMLRETQKLRDEANETSIKLLEIGIERQRVYMERARLNFERMVIHSPIDGMVVAVPFFRSGSMGTVQEGDQVRPGMPFLQVVDSSEMIVRARVNQVDAALLRPNGPVQIRLDAYPDVLLPGRVQNVGTMAQAGGSRGSTGAVKTFPALFAVDGGDPRLIPDISASVDVIIEQAPEALLVPRGAVVLQAGSRQAGFVWVKQGDTVQARSVKLGPRNDTHWAVTGGLQEGELVAALPPAAAVKPPAQQRAPEEPNSNPPAARPAATQGSKGPRSKVQGSATVGPLDLGTLGPCLSASALQSPASSLLFTRAHAAN